MQFLMTVGRVCCSSAMFGSSVKQLKEAVATGTDAAKLHQMNSDLKAYTYNPEVITHMVQDVCRSVCLDLLV